MLFQFKKKKRVKRTTITEYMEYGGKFAKPNQGFKDKMDIKNT